MLKPVENTARNQMVDVLRAVAVLLVLFRHVEVCPEQESATLHALSSILHRGGWVGVDLFFVMSGYLVSRLLLLEHRKHGEVAIGRFLIRRGFKIYPQFWLFLITTLALRAVAGNPVPAREVLGESLFLQNYLAAVWNHTWSLAVEEHFYLVIALLVGWFGRAGGSNLAGRLLWTAAAVMAFCLMARLGVSFSDSPYSFRSHAAYTHLRLDSLFAGVVIAVLEVRHGTRLYAAACGWRAAPLWLAAGLLAIPFVLPLENRLVHTVGFSLFYTGSAALLVLALRTRPSANIGWRALAYVGQRSYSIYLWHMPFLYWFVDDLAGLDPAKSGQWSAYLVVAILGSLALGVVMAAVVEMPLLRLRDRRYASRT